MKWNILYVQIWIDGKNGVEFTLELHGKRFFILVSYCCWNYKWFFFPCVCVCSVHCQICEISTQNPMSVKWPTCFSNKFEINARCFPGVNEKWKKKKLPVVQQYRSSVNSWNAIFMFDANLLIVFLCADEIHLMFSY